MNEPSYKNFKPFVSREKAFGNDRAIFCGFEIKQSKPHSKQSLRGRIKSLPVNDENHEHIFDHEFSTS